MPFLGVSRIQGLGSGFRRIGERADVGVEFIGPVRIGAGCAQHDQPDRVLGGSAHRAESALIADAWQEPGQRVVCCVACGPTLVDPVQHEITTGELVESDRLRRIHQASVPPAAEISGRSG